MIGYMEAPKLDRGIKDMDHPRRRLSNLTSKELHQRAAEYRRMAINCHEQVTAAALNRLAIRYAVLAARRRTEEAGSPASIQNGRDESELAKLIALVNRTAVHGPNPVDTLADTIRVIAGGDADPYLVAGLLLEGSIHVISTRIPRECQTDTAEAFLQLATDRLRAGGMLKGEYMGR